MNTFSDIILPTLSHAEKPIAEHRPGLLYHRFLVYVHPDMLTGSHRWDKNGINTFSNGQTRVKSPVSWRRSSENITIASCSPSFTP